MSSLTDLANDQLPAFSLKAELLAALAGAPSPAISTIDGLKAYDCRRLLMVPPAAICTT